MLTVADLIEELEGIAPPYMADAGDRIGLQVGDPDSHVRRVCVSVDASSPVIDEAIERKADLLVSHHPLIYPSLETVTTDPVAKNVAKLIRANAALFVMHTNYDTVPGGVNDALASKLGVVGCEPLTTRYSDPIFKIVVFVPREAVEQVRDAMADAGAGVIGQYSRCSFRSEGTGTFVPLPGSQPYIGTTGKLEEIQEYRIEMLCAGSQVKGAVAAMLEKHPYDQVAYDLYQLANEPIKYGYGRVGSLEEPMSLGAFLERVKTSLEMPYARAWGDLEKSIKRVAFCSGGASLHYTEAAQVGADVYITGDTKHHEVLDALDRGLAMINAGHFETEKPGMVALAERLEKTYAGSEVEIEYVE